MQPMFAGIGFGMLPEEGPWGRASAYSCSEAEDSAGRRLEVDRAALWTETYATCTHTLHGAPCCSCTQQNLMQHTGLECGQSLDWHGSGDLRGAT